MASSVETKTFPSGGVHPDDGKERTRSLPITVSEPPAVAVVPMVQHIGAPAAPVVKKKDRVAKGQVIGQAQGYVSANVHAPVSGTVSAVEGRIHPVTGTPVTAVIIENDGDDRWMDGMDEPQDVEGMDAAAMLDLVQQCGIVGLGGATFPAHVKLNPPDDMPVTDVFINGTECEPYVTIDHRLMLERTEDIIDGLRLIMRMVDAQKGWVCIEMNKPDAVRAFEQAIGDDPNVRVVPLAVRYPQGAEQQVITAVTGREVPSGGGLPGDVGCLVHNVATTLAIRDAVRFRRPLVERPLTVTGPGVETPGNFVERIGTNVGDILARQGLREGQNRLLLGGPMMGIAQGSFDVPVIKGTSCILLLPEEGMPPQRDCIRCGRCVEHCPLGLMPGEMSIAMERRDWAAAVGYGMLECKECGCCAYVCPARRRIVHMVKFGKLELRRQRAQEKART
jgi:electron transport complex protein RnfC